MMSGAQVIAIASGKGGTGKTVTSVGLARAMVRLGYKVLIVDLDIGLRSAEILLGAERDVIFSMWDVTKGGKTLHNALVYDRDNKDLALLPAPQHCSAGDFSKEDLLKVCERSKYGFGYIIFDCPAGIDNLVRAGIETADRVIAVTTGEAASIRGAGKIAEIARLFEKPVSLLVNMKRDGAHFFSPDTIQSVLEVPLLGCVPYVKDFCIGKCQDKIEYPKIMQDSYLDLAVKIAGSSAAREDDVKTKTPGFKHFFLKFRAAGEKA